MTLLCIAAHPDDEVLGCGGTLARLAAEGHEVHIALLGEGLTSRGSSRGDTPHSAVTDLRKDAQAAALLLGATAVRFEELPDNRFDSIPLLDVVKIVERLVSDVQPHSIYTHHHGDLNVDHRVLHKAVLTATRPLASQVVREIYAFEVPSSTDWAFGRLGPFRPNYFVDVTATLATKISAMESYRSERREFPHPRSPEALAATARRWGSVVGCEAAEAFELVRSIK